jgi:hypothetical protein
MEKLLKVVQKGNNKNFLLVRDDIGKSKQSVFSLPPDGFSYGRPDMKDQEGAGVGKSTPPFLKRFIVTSSWKAHTKTSSQMQERDFKKLNKMQLKDKAIDAKKSTDFRKNNDARMKQLQVGGGPRAVSLPPDQFVFGKPNR